MGKGNIDRTFSISPTSGSGGLVSQTSSSAICHNNYQIVCHVRPTWLVPFGESGVFALPNGLHAVFGYWSQPTSNGFL